MTEPIGHCSECGAEAFDDGDGIVSRCACLAPTVFDDDLGGDAA